MKKCHNKENFFSKKAVALFVISHCFIILPYFICPIFGAHIDILSVLTSIVGIWGIFYIAKGDLIAHYIYILYSILYSIVSLIAGYYGETIIYTFVMLPIHINSILSWKKHLRQTGKKTVEAQKINKKQIIISTSIALVLSVPFYFLLANINTEMPFCSTLSLSSSCLAAYFMLKRTDFFSIIFAFDDLFLIILWSVKMFNDDISCMPTLLVCLGLFISDFYSAISWKKRSNCTRREMQNGKRME